jgi:hypothetical protein
MVNEVPKKRLMSELLEYNSSRSWGLVLPLMDLNIYDSVKEIHQV